MDKIKLNHTHFNEPLGSINYFDFALCAQIFPEYKVDITDGDLVDEYAQRDYLSYCSMLEKFGEMFPEMTKDGKFAGPYNFLMTRKWMMVIPRREEFCNGISVNSIGFAGGILVKNEEQRQMIQEIGF